MQKDSLKINIGRIKAIVFDLGNVIVDLNNELYGKTWPKELKQLEKNWSLKNESPSIEEFFFLYETGQISTRNFIDKLSKISEVSEEEVVLYWNSILLGISQKNINAVEQIGQLMPIYVLSNTNDLHIKWIFEYLETIGYSNWLSNTFNTVFYSHKIHAVKPFKNCYRIVDQQIPFSEEEILFIDDKLENIEALKCVGWQGICLKNIEDLVPILSEIKAYHE